MAIDSLLASRH